MEATNVGAASGTTRDIVTMTIAGAIAASIGAIVAFKLNEERIFSFARQSWITVTVITMLCTFAILYFLVWIASLFPDEVKTRCMDHVVTVALKKTSIELSDTDAQLLTESMRSIKTEIAKNSSVSFIRSDIIDTSDFLAQAEVGNRTEGSSADTRLLHMTGSLQTDVSINSLPAVEPKLQAAFSRRLSTGREQDDMQCVTSSELGKVEVAAETSASIKSMPEVSEDLPASPKKRRLSVGRDHDDLLRALSESKSPIPSELVNVGNAASGFSVLDADPELQKSPKMRRLSAGRERDDMQHSQLGQLGHVDDATDFHLRAALAASMQPQTVNSIPAFDADLQAALEASRRLSADREHSDIQPTLNESGSLLTVDAELEAALQASRRPSSNPSGEPLDIEAIQLEAALAESMQTRPATSMQTDVEALRLESSLAAVNDHELAAALEASLLGEGYASSPYATPSADFARELDVAHTSLTVDRPANDDSTLQAVLAMSLQEY